MMNPTLNERITLEHALFAAAFGLALGIRMLNLGATPLSDYEATWALQALDIARGGGMSIGPNPGYVFLTGGSIYLFGSSNFLARFWPALAGSILVLAPLLFRHKLGRWSAVIMAFGLSLEPGLVAMSRQAGGPMMAVGFGLTALGFAYMRKPVLAGICAGIALLSGPAVLLGGVGLGLVWGLAHLVGLLTHRNDDQLEDPNEEQNSIPQAEWKRGSLTLVATVLLGGTFFSLYPQGLGAWAAMLTTFFEGWFVYSGVPGSRVLAALVFYQPFGLLFGALAFFRGWMRRDQQVRILSVWFTVALLIPLVYPGRAVGDVTWALIPLWGLAASELARIRIANRDKAVAWAHAGLVWVLSVLVWLNFSGLGLSLDQPDITRARWLIVAGASALGFVATVLVSLGWSWPAGRNGLVIGLGMALGLYSLANVFWVSQVRSNRATELWARSPSVLQADLMIQTLGDLGELENGRRDFLEVVSLVDTPSLRWALRDISEVSYVSRLDVEVTPAAILTWADQTAPSQTESYRGQDFIWRVSPGWERGLPPDLPRWIVFRDAPVQERNIVLWGRADLFPGGTLEAQEEESPPSQEEGEGPLE